MSCVMEICDKIFDTQEIQGHSSFYSTTLAVVGIVALAAIAMIAIGASGGGGNLADHVIEGGSSFIEENLVAIGIGTLLVDLAGAAFVIMIVRTVRSTAFSSDTRDLQAIESKLQDQILESEEQEEYLLPFYKKEDTTPLDHNFDQMLGVLRGKSVLNLDLSTCIKWLFPNLGTDHFPENFRNDPAVQENAKQAFEAYLHFLGVQLDEGEVFPGENWDEQKAIWLKKDSDRLTETIQALHFLSLMGLQECMEPLKDFLLALGTGDGKPYVSNAIFNAWHWVGTSSSASGRSLGLRKGSSLPLQELQESE